MSKVLKKMLAILLSISMVSSVFIGCNSSSTSSTSDSESTDSDEKTKLTLWHIQTDTAKDIIHGSVERFMDENPQYEVEVVDMSNDSYKQKLSLAMSSNQTPDVYVQWGGANLATYVEAGQCADITEFMETDNYKDQFIDAAIQQCTYDEKIYAVPVENVSVAGIFYNKEVFEKYGLEEPTTISELEAVCEKLKSEGVTPFALANSTKWTGSMYFMYLATRYGGLTPFEDAVSGNGSFENEAFEYAGTKIQEWVNAGYFNEGFNGMDDDSGQARQLLYKGEAAMDLMGSWFTGTVNGENPEFIDKIGFFSFPELEGSTADQKLCIGTVGDNLYSVSESCQDKEGAFKLIQSLLDDEAIKERTEYGKIIPIKEFVAEDDLTKEILEVVNESTGVQLWYDQSLPAEVAEVHKTTSQEIFGLTMTPQEANQELQKAMDAYKESSSK